MSNNMLNFKIFARKVLNKMFLEFNFYLNHIALKLLEPPIPRDSIPQRIMRDLRIPRDLSKCIPARETVGSAAVCLTRPEFL